MGVLSDNYNAGRFFASYHSIRMTLKLYVPLQPEENVFTAGLITLTPLVVMRRFRPVLPYAMLLVVMDAFGGMNDL